MMAIARREKPGWMHDCKYIDQLADGETAYTISWAFVQPQGEDWYIARDEFCSSVRRGTHDVMITREQDIVYVRDGKMTGDKNSHGMGYALIEGNSFPAIYKPLTLEEKVNILWGSR